MKRTQPGIELRVRHGEYVFVQQDSFTLAMIHKFSAPKGEWLDLGFVGINIEIRAVEIPIYKRTTRMRQLRRTFSGKKSKTSQV